MVQIETILQNTAESLCRKITSDLPEYFGLPEVNEHYALGMHSHQNLAAKIGDDYIGLISLEFPYSNNCNIYWMAVLRQYHGQGIGRKLIEAACSFAKKNNAKTITVETLAPYESDENYLKTYHFYQKNGFAPLINLKPQGYDWKMVYMVRTLEVVNAIQTNRNISIRLFKQSDIPVIIDAFKKADWPKPTSTFEAYLKEQFSDLRLVWVAFVDDQFAGYVTLKWQSQYEPFANANIAEIMDLNVLPLFRKAGVGSKLLAMAENEAATKNDVVGLGVGLYGGPDGGYGAAQRLYVNSGYVPDGKGVTYSYQYATPGDSFPLDDDLVLWLIKKLR